MQLVDTLQRRLGSLFRKKWLLQFAFVFVLLALLPAFALPLGINWENDAADYRIPIVRWILRHHAYPNWSWTFVDDYPMLPELLMVPFYAMTPVLVRLVPVAAYIGTSLLFGSLVSNWQKRKNSSNADLLFWVATTWALSLRPLGIQACALMTDMWVAMGIIGAIGAVERRSLPALFFFSALAAASRYSAIPALVALVLSLLLAYPKEWKLWGIAAFGFFAGLFPTMVRNVIVNEGNPIFPLAIKFFGPAQVNDPTSMHFSWFGRGTSLYDLALLPYDLLITNSFFKGLYDYVLGKPYLIQLAAVCFIVPFLCWKNRRMGRIQPLDRISAPDAFFRFLVIFLILSTIVWFYSAQQMRYLVATLLISQALLIHFLFQRKAMVTATLLGLLCIPGMISLQSEYVRTIRDHSRSSSLTEYARVKDCFAMLPTGTLVGHSGRYGVLAFFDYDFVFVGSNPFRVSRKPDVLETPEFIFGNLDPRYGNTYEPWPMGEPCMFKKVALP